VARNFLTSLKLVNLTSDPPTGSEGELYYNTVSDKVRLYSNGAWISLAPIDSPTFTGTPTAPTASSGTNTTQIATTAFVTTAVSSTSSGFEPFFLAGL